MSGNISVQEILALPEMADVVTELSDPKFASRRHNSRATYALGCHGPLCGKAERDRGRSRNAKKATEAGRSYREGYRKYDRDALLDYIAEWHKYDLAIRKLKAS
jgi:hypothetical protein